MSSSFSYAKSALMLMESTANLRAWLVLFFFFFIILDIYNLALYLLKALALPKPGSIKPDTSSLVHVCGLSASASHVNLPMSCHFLLYR